MVKGFFEQLGCQESRVYDVGMTEWGAPGNPVVYARCDEGAPRTLAIYWQYDTMPITQPDAWKAPPFEARIIEQAPYKKVLIGRGATNSKGPRNVQFNALLAIKAVTGKLPVNIIFIAEGDEERMAIGVRKFVKNHPEFFKNVDALYRRSRSESASGGGSVGGGSEGCVYVELTTSGQVMGPRSTCIGHPRGNKRSVDSPAWRHMQMLEVAGVRRRQPPLVEGFTEYRAVVGHRDGQQLQNAAAKNVDMKVAAENLGVARFIADDPLTMLKMARYGISINLDGIWGGNMYAGGAGAILPNKITSKHNFRYVPKMDGIDIMKQLREQLDRNGFKDVEMKVIGDVPWAKMRYDTDIARAMNADVRPLRHPHGEPADVPSILGGYWPVVSLLVRQSARNGAGLDADRHGRRGHGGNAHAANEYFVIEGAGKVYGMAGAEKVASPRSSTISPARTARRRLLPARRNDRVDHGPGDAVSRSRPHEDVRRGGGARARAPWRHARDSPRRIRGGRRTLGVGEVDLHAHPRLPG